MSNLLFDDKPIVVSPRLAESLGDVDQAIILQQIHYWLQKSNKVIDGRRWVYNSMNDWLKQFPWVKSRTTLNTKFNKLEKSGLLITSNYNKAGFDKTKWYSIDYDALSEIEQRLTKNDQRATNNWSTIDQKLNNGVTNNWSTNTIDYTENTTEINNKDDGGGGNYIYIAGQPIDKLHDSGILNGDQIRYLYAVDSAVIEYINHWSATANQNKVAYAVAIINRLMNDGVMTVADVDSNKYTSKQPPRVEPDELPNIDIIKLYD